MSLTHTSQHGDGQGWSKDAPVRAVSQVIRKLEDGTYPTEPTRCFCGADPSRDTVITEFDRYTIPHRMVLCEACCLIRANPRMTPAAYADFYNTEYRQIYDGFPYQEHSENDDYLFQLQVAKGAEVREFVKAFDIQPASVLDIGCDKGGTLIPFKEEGATVYGVELCDRGRAYTASKGIPVLSTIDEWISKGVKVDLIIMQDIIEHLMDLREMEKIRHLLTPKGVIFLYTPGLLACDPGHVFQNAHTFQFIAVTLEYVMERLGYAAEVLNDRVVSLWRYTGITDFAQEPPISWRKYIVEHLMQTEQRTVPPVHTACKFSHKEMLSNLDQNLALHLPTIETIRNTFIGPCVVVGGGPSVDGQLETIKDLIAKGHKLVVIERMYPWATQQGLKVDFVVSLDASDGVEAGFTHLQQDAIHLMVATNNPKVFPLLTGYTQYLWSGAASSYPEAAELWRKHGYTRVTIVNTGGSVTLASIFLSLVLGFRDVSLFGFDCMVPAADRGYASGIAGESVARSYFEATVEGSTVLTCSSFLSFAQQFFGMIDVAEKWGMLEAITVYGESLVNAMATGQATTPWHYQVEKTVEA